MLNSPAAQRRAWRLRGSSGDYEVIRAFELDEEEEAEHVVPAEQLQREFDAWVKFSVGAVRELLGEMDRVVPSSLPPWEEDRQLKRGLAELFQSGRLVAFYREPKQASLGVLIKPATAAPRDAVDAAELAREPKPAQAAPARNVNTAQQDNCLTSAAQDGTPFCEICENLKRGVTT